MQEGDVQIKDNPIRLPSTLRWCSGESGRLHGTRQNHYTPLKDRIGSEIRTHYPATVEEGIAITAQEAGRGATGTYAPAKLCARSNRARGLRCPEDKKIDKRSGVSHDCPSRRWKRISNAE